MRFLDHTWTRLHALPMAAQIATWFFFFWALIPLLIWRASRSVMWKAGVTVIFVAVPIVVGALGPSGTRPTSDQRVAKTSQDDGAQSTSGTGDALDDWRGMSNKEIARLIVSGDGLDDLRSMTNKEITRLISKLSNGGRHKVWFTLVPPETQGGKTCDPNYTGACIPSYQRGLDCTEASATNFRSVGSDPHGFDSDNDGIACES
ncbi:MAG: excalibur calcium-binding domain-containing protein [Actinomycetota bacterium]